MDSNEYEASRPKKYSSKTMPDKKLAAGLKELIDRKLPANVRAAAALVKRYLEMEN